MSNSNDLLDDLRGQRTVIANRIGADQGRLDAIDRAIAAIEELDGPPRSTALDTALSQIMQHVQAGASWLTYREIVQALSTPESPRSRAHVIRTQIGQLVRRGSLRQCGRLVGLPSWSDPPPEALPRMKRRERYGDRINEVESVVRAFGRPVRITDIGAELARRGFNADERCVATCLYVYSRGDRKARFIRSGPAMFAIKDAHQELTAS